MQALGLSRHCRTCQPKRRFTDEVFLLKTAVQAPQVQILSVFITRLKHSRAGPQSLVASTLYLMCSKLLESTKQRTWQRH